MAEPTIVVAFIAGFLSFLSPCVLPLIPGFLAYLSGTTPGVKGARLKVFLNSVSFVLGFSAVFSLLGVLLSTALAGSSDEVLSWLSKIGGALIIAFGFHVLGFIRIPFLEREHRLKVTKKFSITYVASFVFGAAFAAGWTPCVTGLLAAILALAIANPAQSFFLLLSYSIGLGVPFLIIGVFGTHVLEIMQKFRTFFRYFNVFTGVLLVLLGLLIFTDNLAVASGLILRWIGFL